MNTAPARRSGRRGHVTPADLEPTAGELAEAREGMAAYHGAASDVRERSLAFGYGVARMTVGAEVAAGALCRGDLAAVARYLRSVRAADAALAELTGDKTARQLMNRPAETTETPGGGA